MHAPRHPSPAVPHGVAKLVAKLFDDDDVWPALRMPSASVSRGPHVLLVVEQRSEVLLLAGTASGHLHVLTTMMTMMTTMPLTDVIGGGFIDA